MIAELTNEAVANGARRDQACTMLGIDVRTIQRWSTNSSDKRGQQTRPPPANRLSDAERAQIIAIATSPEFRDVSPKQIVPALADRGLYVASEATMYRSLRAENLQHHRGRQRQPQPRPHQHVASAPWQVASWDITYLKTAIKGQFYYLYMFMDVWSRKIIGFEVHEEESAEHAASLIESIRYNHKDSHDLSGLVLHSDNGGPMKGAFMQATLNSLGIVASFSRPRVSDDNPFSEALFRTIKYAPSYPGRFSTLAQARAWVAEFVHWYNNQHLHSGIGYVSPANRHDGADIKQLQQRKDVYQRARDLHPERWARHTRSWQRPGDVYLNPDKHKLSGVAA